MKISILCALLGAVACAGSVSQLAAVDVCVATPSSGEASTDCVSSQQQKANPFKALPEGVAGVAWGRLPTGLDNPVYNAYIDNTKENIQAVIALLNSTKKQKGLRSDAKKAIDVLTKYFKKLKAK